MRKGILLAGGNGTRLHPVTRAVSKQLMPVYDKPMIYYPLSVLMLAGIRNVLVITTPRDGDAFSALLGDGSQWGMTISYAAQPRPDGIAQAFLIARSFLAGDACTLVLGDNLFYGHGLPDRLRQASSASSGATVFAYRVKDPQRYGVVAFDAHHRATAIVEKPAMPPSPFAVTGLYFYDGDIVSVAQSLKPSGRGELEITDINQIYLDRQHLAVEILGRGFAWFDAGTHDALLEAAQFIQVTQNRQGILIASPEEIAWRAGWITAEELLRQAGTMAKTSYGEALLGAVEQS
ncbi:MAG TPA: glucose-1-phosphate thymidylyltransferase RfbA [Alphaproteobacteria bacterium]|nr:glucose-1-phosphate thymidylyltransferase RfbA [Alphaproteobacteria bacterium]